MWYLTIIGVVAGILAASSLVISKKPNAKELIDKLVPYQGWIWVSVFFYGIYDIISVIGLLGNINIVLWILWLVIAISEIIVGFLLWFGLISKYALSKNEAALKKGQEIRLKLVKIQVPMWIVLASSSILFLILWFVL